MQNSCIHIHQAEASGAVRPGAGGPVVALRRAAGARTEARAALTGLGLAARVGNLQLEGEPGERWLCPAASLPLAARKRLSQVLLSSIAGPVPGAGRWLAPPSPRHRLHGWARRNAPPGGSEFPFRCGSSFSKLVLQGGEGGGCRSGFSVFPQRSWVPLTPPSPVARPGRAGSP